MIEPRLGEVEHLRTLVQQAVREATRLALTRADPGWPLAAQQLADRMSGELHQLSAWAAELYRLTPNAWQIEREENVIPLRRS